MARTWTRWHSWMRFSALSLAAPVLFGLLRIGLEEMGVQGHGVFCPPSANCNLPRNLTDYALIAYLTTGMFAVFVVLPSQVVALAVYLVARWRSRASGGASSASHGVRGSSCPRTSP